jgi:hypothetical protein
VAAELPGPNTQGSSYKQPSVLTTNQQFTEATGHSPQQLLILTKKCSLYGRNVGTKQHKKTNSSVPPAHHL